jgi:uncharacterized membrane protein YgdD (TMEM256/DUF423 family)
MTSALLVLACLMGACGVGLAAAAAHGTSATGLDSAAWLLLFHATAILGAASLATQQLLWRPLALVAMLSFVAGAALFAGDVAMRAFAGAPVPDGGPDRGHASAHRLAHPRCRRPRGHGGSAAKPLTRHADFRPGRRKKPLSQARPGG